MEYSKTPTSTIVGIIAEYESVGHSQHHIVNARAELDRRIPVPAAKVEPPGFHCPKTLRNCEGRFCVGSICERLEPNDPAIVRRREAAGGWRPIETIPRNGDWVVAARFDTIVPVVVRANASGTSYYDNRGVPMRLDDLSWWMPLPEAPR